MTKLYDVTVEWQEVEELIPHENYKGLEDIYEYDIALIKVKSEIVYNKKVQPVDLPSSDNIDGNITAIVTGWGNLAVSKILSFFPGTFSNS